MAYSDNFPATRPVFQADFANGGRIDPRATFSRSDSPIDATKAAASAVHFWSNEKHLSSDNLLLQSSDFDTTWSANGLNGTPTSGQADPAGGTDGFTLVEDSSTGIHRISQNVTASGDLALTVYAKQNSGTRYLTLALYYATGNTAMAVYDLAGGAPATATGGSSTYTSVSASQTASGNGYYKCVLKATGSATVAIVNLNDVATTVGLDTNWGTKSYSGDNSSSLDIAFASLTSTGATDYQSTTTQIHREYAPTLKSVSTAGAARFEYDPTDGQSAGILIEGQATSLISYSESFSNQTVNSCTLTEGAAVGPTGTLNANLLVPTATGTVVRNVNLDDGNAISHTSGNNYAFSIYAKAAGYNYLQWVGGAYFGYTYCNFDLSNGTVGSKSGSVTGSVESVGNGFYRLTVIAPATTTNSTTSKGIWGVVTSSTAARNEQWTGNAYSGVLLTMAQCELGSHSSSYIASNSGAAAGTTRAADSLSVVDSSLFDNGGGSVVVETENVGRGYYAATLSDGSSGNYKDWVSLIVQDNDTIRQAVNAPDATSSSNLYSSASTVGGSFFKVASRFAPNDFGVCIDGGTVATDTTGAVPSNVDKLFIGWYQDGGRANAHIKRVAVYSEPLSDTNLQSLTAS